jgi:hypothetical protein
MGFGSVQGGDTRMSEHTDFTAAYEKVLTALGIWKAGEKCEWPVVNMPPKRLAHLSFRCRCPQCGHIVEGCTFKGKHFHEGGHDIPPPELTPALAWRVLVAALSEHDLRLSSVYEAFAFAVDADGDDAFDEKVVTDADPKCALILALAQAL